ncbi:MAG TPA: DUF4203 domain-containing protein [Chloroflexota bacterium]|nr:DUF4203 domain-containing protein [Chloroflexota bacterium]
MTGESFFALAVSSMIAMFFGAVLAFAGYRFFLVLLPIWGFFFGFGLGAQTVQALFGEGFLSTVSSWLVGFVVALIFAVCSYLFYFFAVALIGASLGYALGVGLMQAIGFNLEFLTWLVGIIAGLAFGAAVLLLNIQKWVIIIATALLGAGVIVGTFLFLFGDLPPDELVQNPVRFVLQTSPLWALVFLLVAVLGGVAQAASTRRWQVTTYNRWETLAEPTAATPPAGA